MDDGANSSLAVARADKFDSGNYTCSISPTEFATVAVHVLNGEAKTPFPFDFIITPFDES
jgi:hypothetical protein